MRSASSARTFVRALQRAVPQASRGVTVLAYHLVEGGTGGPVDLPLATFTAHLDHLTSRARVVPLCEADPSGGPDQVALTFDDAYLNFHDVIWPLLRERNLPATLYVPIDYVDGGPAPIRGTTLPPCSWEQLRSMASEGLDIGSHTSSHPDLRTLDATGIQREVVASRQVLETRIGVPVRSFCYPRGLHTAASRRAVQQTYQLGVVGGGRKYRVGTPTSRVPRISLRRDHPIDRFVDLIHQRVWLEELLADVARQWLA